jgi:hypothetical protein
LSHRYCYLPLSWKSWNRFECAVGGVSTASGICHTVTAILRYRGRVGTDLSVLWVAYLQHLVFVTPLLLSYAIVEELEPV